MIPKSAQTLIETWRTGFIATADAEGRPNVSPKGTFLVVDDRTIAFAELRSPNTLANIAVRAEVEVNFLDVLSRKGVRVRGEARFAATEDAEAKALLPRFTTLFGEEFAKMVNGVVLIAVAECRPLTSPIYDIGAEEAAVRASYAERIANIHEVSKTGGAS